MEILLLLKHRHQKTHLELKSMILLKRAVGAMSKKVLLRMMMDSVASS